MIEISEYSTKTIEQKIPVNKSEDEALLLDR